MSASAQLGIPMERKAELFDNALSKTLESFSGEVLYGKLHDDYKMTLQEIRTIGFFSDEDISSICRVPPQALSGHFQIQDFVHMEGISSLAVFSVPDSYCAVPLEALGKLTDSGREEYSDLLAARVTDIRVDCGVPELLLDGIDPQKLEDFCEDLDAHTQAEQAMGLVF